MFFHLRLVAAEQISRWKLEASLVGLTRGDTDSSSRLEASSPLGMEPICSLFNTSSPSEASQLSDKLETIPSQTEQTEQIKRVLYLQKLYFSPWFTSFIIKTYVSQQNMNNFSAKNKKSRQSKLFFEY